WFDARASGRLGISDRVPSLAAYIVCVPTPVDDDGKPDLGPLAASLRGIGAAMKPRALVMVESTLPPGGSRLAVPILEEACRGLAGDTFLYAYVPERVLPGDVVREIRENARIVGTRDERARVAAEALLRIYVKGEIRHTDPETAEMVKLAENSYRMVNVGFANEIAGLCESAGVDGREVIRLANLHPRVRILDPGPGVAGPCLPKDPRLLAHGREGDSRLILAALEANERARERLFSALQAALRLAGRTIRGARVLVLGVAYKGGIADTTGSPGLWLARRIRDEGGEPVLCDPRSSLPGERVLKDAYEGADGCVAAVVCTEHPEYRSLDLERLRRAMADRPALVDGRGVVPDAPGFVFRTPVRPAR
ncbi:MAG TPA: nucleotide sugar dehydrogenase, partial [Thermoplasmata archaeon]|nr:nucleotide sugar dehydrogenase [Thermoplasmata archaeon]